MSQLHIRPCDLKTAQRFVAEHHRHNGAPVGHKFSIACYEGDRLCGVAICGRPVGRYLDDGLTLEINRVCTDGTANACSKLYGAAQRVAKAMGYRRCVTYTLASETSASLKASNWCFDGPAGKSIPWTGQRYKDKEQQVPKEIKTRWVKNL